MIAGGHTFGKTHGAGPSKQHVGSSPKARPLRSRASAGQAAYATGIAGTRSPAAWKSPGPARPRNGATTIFDHLFKYEWELTKSPGGAHQWKPKGDAGAGTVPDAHDPSKRHAPAMLTTDLSLRSIRSTRRSRRRFYEHPAAFADAFARAWFKLTHRDMGPRARYLGPEVPEEELLWQDPIPARNHALVDDRMWLAESEILASGFSVSSSSRPLGPRPPPSVHPTSVAARTAPASAWPHKRIGRSISRRSCPRC